MSGFSRSGAPFLTVMNHVAPHGARRDGSWHYPVFQRKYRDSYVDLMPPSYGGPAAPARRAGQHLHRVRVRQRVPDRRPPAATDRYLFAVHAGNPTVGLLFDRELDPHSTVNRFDDPAYAEVRLLARTRELAACSGVADCNREFGALPEPG